MKRKLTQLISVILIAIFAWQNLAWGNTKGAAALTAVWAARPLSPGQKAVPSCQLLVPSFKLATGNWELGTNLRPLAMGERKKELSERVIRVGSVMYIPRDYTVLRVASIKGNRFICDYIDARGEVSRGNLRTLAELVKEGTFVLRPHTGKVITIRCANKTFLIDAEGTRRLAEHEINAINIVTECVGYFFRSVKKPEFYFHKIPDRVPIALFDANKIDEAIKAHEIDLKAYLVTSMNEWLRIASTPEHSLAPLLNGNGRNHRAVESSILRPLAMDEKSKAGGESPQPDVVLSMIKQILEATYAYHKNLKLCFAHPDTGIRIGVSYKPLGIQIADKKTADGLLYEPLYGVGFAGAIQAEFTNLTGLVRQLMLFSKHTGSQEETKAILREINNLYIAFMQKKSEDIEPIYRDGVFPLIDQLMFNHLETALRAAVDARERDKAEQLVARMHNPQKGVSAILVTCPLLKPGPDGTLSAKNDKETYAPESDKIDTLRNVILATLNHYGITDTFLAWWAMEELGVDMLIHPRDTLKGEKNISLFGVIIAEFTKGADNSVNLRLTFHDNGGGVDIDDLLDRMMASIGKNIELPTGRGIYVLCDLLFKKGVGNQIFYIVSQGRRAVFTDFIAGKGPQVTTETDPMLENGFYARVSCSFSVATPSEQIRAVEKTDSFALSSVLRPRAAADRAYPYQQLISDEMRKLFANIQKHRNFVVIFDPADEQSRKKLMAAEEKAILYKDIIFMLALNASRGLSAESVTKFVWDWDVFRKRGFDLKAYNERKNIETQPDKFPLVIETFLANLAKGKVIKAYKVAKGNGFEIQYRLPSDHPFGKQESDRRNYYRFVQGTLLSWQPFQQFSYEALYANACRELRAQEGVKAVKALAKACGYPLDDEQVVITSLFTNRQSEFGFMLANRAERLDQKYPPPSEEAKKPKRADREKSSHVIGIVVELGGKSSKAKQVMHFTEPRGRERIGNVSHYIIPNFCRVVFIHEGEAGSLEHPLVTRLADNLSEAQTGRTKTAEDLAAANALNKASLNKKFAPLEQAILAVCNRWDWGTHPYITIPDIIIQLHENGFPTGLNDGQPWVVEEVGKTPGEKTYAFLGDTRKNVIAACRRLAEPERNKLTALGEAKIPVFVERLKASARKKTFAYQLPAMHVAPSPTADEATASSVLRPRAANERGQLESAIAELGEAGNILLELLLDDKYAQAQGIISSFHADMIRQIAFLRVAANDLKDYAPTIEASLGDLRILRGNIGKLLSDLSVETRNSLIGNNGAVSRAIAHVEAFISEHPEIRDSVVFKVSDPFPQLENQSVLTLLELETVFSCKYASRNLLRGGPIEQPPFFILFQRDPELEGRLKRSGGDLWEIGPSVKLATASDVRNFDEVIGEILDGRIPLPLIYKPNRSGIGRGIFHLTSESPGTITVTMVHGLESARHPIKDYLKKLSIEGLKVDDQAYVAHLALDPQKHDIKRILHGLWRLISINEETKWYDPGLMESRMSFITINGERAYETRHYIEGSLCTGNSCVIDGVSFARIGASKFFSNQTGREPRGLELKGGDMFLPLYNEYIPLDRRQEFEVYVNQLLRAEFRYMTERLKAGGVVTGEMIRGVFDLMWLKPEDGGFPRPVIIEISFNFITGNSDKDIIVKKYPTSDDKEFLSQVLRPRAMEEKGLNEAERLRVETLIRTSKSPLDSGSGTSLTAAKKAPYRYRIMNNNLPRIHDRPSLGILKLAQLIKQRLNIEIEIIAARKRIKASSLSINEIIVLGGHLELGDELLIVAYLPAEKSSAYAEADAKFVLDLMDDFFANNDGLVQRDLDHANSQKYQVQIWKYWNETKNRPVKSPQGRGVSTELTEDLNSLGIDLYMFTKFAEEIFDQDNAVSKFVRDEARAVLQSDIPDLCIEATSMADVRAHLTKEDLNMPEYKSSQDAITLGIALENYFTSAAPVDPKVYVLKLKEGANEYLWICSYEGRKFDGSEQFFERFFANKIRVAHGYTNVYKKVAESRLGVQKYARHLLEPGDMKILYKMRCAVFARKFSPKAFIFPAYQISDPRTFFFYIRKGHLPLETQARRKTIDNFLTSWLADRKYTVFNPDEMFGDKLVSFISKNSRYFIFFLEDPRLPLPEAISHEPFELERSILRPLAMEESKRMLLPGNAQDLSSDKRILEAIEYFKKNKIPATKTDVAKKAGINKRTVYRRIEANVLIEKAINSLPDPLTTDQKLMEAIDRLKKDHKPVTITSIAEEASCHRWTVSERMKLNPTIEAAVKNSYISANDQAILNAFEQTQREGLPMANFVIAILSDVSEHTVYRRSRANQRIKTTAQKTRYRKTTVFPSYQEIATKDGDNIYDRLRTTSVAPGPLEAAMAKELLTAVNRTIEALPTRKRSFTRRVIWAIYNNGLSNDYPLEIELSRILNTEPRKIKSVLDIFRMSPY